MNINYLKYISSKPFKSWKNKYLKSVTKKDAIKNDLYNKIAREIAEYTHEPIEIVKQKHKLGPESERNFNIFRDQQNLAKTDVESFYKDCSYYLYELPLWNAERNRPKYLSMLSLPYIKRNNYKKVMDMGGGAGDLSIELANSNLDVTYCDIGECLFDFAKWRFARRGLPIKMVKGIENVLDKDYDCIFSFDTFEHIKNLPEMLKKIVACLKPKGSLIFSGAFSGGTLHLEENEQYDEFNKLDAFMESCNLKFQDKFAQFYFYKRKGDISLFPF